MPAEASILSSKCPYAIENNPWEPSLIPEPVPGPTGMERNLPVSREIILDTDLWPGSGKMAIFFIINGSPALLSYTDRAFT